ncbi:hypothetical protein [Chitinophaga nivalis]|uniref:Uncharacterized protein n=1 Tax=Chitinophaga nivalis TaxID=2991709 RepID=A0ABT3INN6_9BACT|nr:hypothetical protein [Chitinophaga nivalis]MCW3464761.1 hypothetical protein [Chitinophaga nivalis]MCW3485548.1 hypothetical protein [Chitinophaga nivalis]
MDDNIDFSLMLHKHGWITFLINVDGVIHEILVSSVLSSPVYDITNLLLALLNNEDEISVNWFGEPDWSVIRVTRGHTERHILSVEVGSCIDQQGSDYKKVVDFKIKFKQLLIILFYQLKKNYHLLTEKSFANGREREFSYELYNKLNKKIETDFPGIL